jgi:hypothetical protein
MTMHRFMRIAALVFMICALGVGHAFAQAQTGTVEGKVTDQQGGLLPGVTVTLTGPRGTQTTVSDAAGVYRFVGVQPATYVLRVEMTGFVPQERTDVRILLGTTVTNDFTLQIKGATETVEVSATASQVDVRSAATDTSVSSQMLQMTPLYSSTATGLLNAAPGINNSSGYGGQASYGNALLLDGVDTRDPEGGSAWTFFNQNLIEEIQIGGLGAPAEYGGFTGAIINTITKSGGNRFSGLFSYRYTNDDLAGSNISDEQLNLNEDLGDSAVTKKLADYTVQMGGPLKQDKAFFFLSVQRYYATTDPIGPVQNSTDISPRFNGKVSFQPTTSDTFTLGLQYDQYNLDGRVGAWPASQATDQQTVTEDAPEWVWNAQWRRVFGTSALLEAKFTGYDGYYYLDPVDPSVYTVDAETTTYCCGGGGGLYYADRSRNQFQVAFTKFAEKFGRHSLKFGAEIERSGVRSQYQPYGPAGFYIYNYYGTPYRVSYGYDVQGDNRRTSAYVQDQWNAGRATLNIGLRMDRIRGYSPVLDETVYEPQTAWGPRIGVAYDLTGRGTTALKGFWGRYYEGAASAFFTSATPGIQDYTWQEIFPDGSLGEIQNLAPAQVYGIAEDMKHPRTDDMNLSFETQLWGGNRFSVTGMWRFGGNFVNHVIRDARFEPVELDNDLTGQTFTGYAWANPDVSDQSFFITNTKGFQYLDVDGNVISTAEPERKYRALMLLLSNQLRSRLGYQLSYVLAKAEGNVDNTGFGAHLGGTGWFSPNTATINSYGELTNSRRHEFKAYFTYLIPRIDIMIGGNYTGLSGRNYNVFEQYGSGTLGLPGGTRRQILLEPRGSRRLPAFHQVDIRAEKAFRIEGHRFGIYMDAINLFNSNAITAVQTRYSGSGGIDFEAPTGVQGARQITFGGRWAF